MSMKNIDLDVFLAIMDGQVTEGDNDTFYVDESGVRSTFAPTVADRAELVRQGHLFSKKTRGGPCDENTKERTGEWQQSEADVLREFANECRFDFPITLDTAMAWAANIISMDPSEVEANYRARKGEPTEHAENEIRKDFTPSERVAIAKAIEDELKATERRGRPRAENGRSGDLIYTVNPEKFEPVIRRNLDELSGQRSDEIAAKKAGFGNKDTYRQAKTVVEHAKSEPIAGKRGAPIKIPDEAIELARQLYLDKKVRSKKEAGMTAAEHFKLDPITQGKTIETYMGRPRK